jgi:hypothetical protein
VSANKKVVKVEIGGKEVELAVLRPNAKQRQEAQKVYNRAFREAVESGAILRAKIESVMREQKLWDDQKEAELRKLQTSISEKERKVRSGGIKLSEARDLAIQLRRDRAELRGLNSERMSLDNNSAEAQADNAQFNYWVSVCTVHANDGKPYFKSYEEYMTKEDDPAVGPAASALAKIIYNLEDDYEKKLPENQFLVKYKFADESLHLVDKQGRKVDAEGRLVDENGRYINEAGQFVDRDGNLVDEEGNFVVDEKPFLDDEGNPISVEVSSSTQAIAAV